MPRRTAPPDPSIGDRIRSRRELRGWSIRHAASRAGVAHSTWSRIEHGTLGTDNRFILAKVAEAFGVFWPGGDPAAGSPTRAQSRRSLN
jgi:transcriptional regulator with XRE-family HTH domain